MNSSQKNHRLVTLVRDISYVIIPTFFSRFFFPQIHPVIHHFGAGGKLLRVPL